MALRVLVLHGPNVESFGEGRSIEVLDAQLAARAQALGFELKTFHANGEAALLDELYAQRTWADAAVVNPGSLAPVAYGLADALASWGKPSVEVLLEHESKGRGKSALRRAVDKQLHGQGDAGYLKALALLGRPKEQPPRTDAPPDLREVMERTAATGDALAEVQHLARSGAAARAAARHADRAAREALRDASAPSAEAPSGGEQRRQSKSLGRGNSPDAGSDHAAATARRAADTTAASKTIGRAEPKAAARPAAGPRKTIGRRDAATSADAPPRAGRGQLLTRADVKSRVLDRLSGKLTPEQLALWARSQWASLQSGGPVEDGRREVLDEVLLLLAASARATDDVLLSTVAKLDA